MNHTNMRTKAILYLPGRGGNLNAASTYQSLLPYTTVIGVQPDREWYPAPNGPLDQREAVEGLKKAATDFNEYVLNKICPEINIAPTEIVLAGHSAGGVVAIQAACEADWKYKAVIVHSGCVLDRNILPKKKNDVAFYFYHAMDDEVFGYKERYEPSFAALTKAGYFCVEQNKVSGHAIVRNDIVNAVDQILKAL